MKLSMILAAAALASSMVPALADQDASERLNTENAYSNCMAQQVTVLAKMTRDVGAIRKQALKSCRTFVDYEMRFDPYTAKRMERLSGELIPFLIRQSSN